MSIDLGTRIKREDRIDDLPSLFLKLSHLLKEGYQFNTALIMLLPYYTKNAKKWQNVVQTSLNEGMDVSEILQRFRVGQEFLIAIHFADKHGNLATTLEYVSKQMTYQFALRKKLIKIFMYPIFLFCLLICFFIGFRMYFLPNISSLLSSRSDATDKTLWLSRFFLHMPDYFLALFVSAVLALVLCVVWFKRKPIEEKLKLLLKLPLLNRFYKMQMTRHFARNLGNLLQTGFSLQEALDHLKNQKYKDDLKYIASEIEQRVLFGDSLTQCVKKLPFFYPKFELFVDHGEKGGHLGRELVLYCDMLDEKLKENYSFIFSFIQPFLFVIIATCIVAAYLSILLPMYKMIDII